MYSEDIHLREWGELKDEYLGPAFIRKFEEGDVLYGSRRTYLRKVVVAPFDGITSNTTFVIKANEGLIDKRLLPFIMLSEGFTQHSIQNSKGSVNPYVNWKDLSSYEFLLPKVEHQRDIIDLFLAINEYKENLMRLQTHNSILKESIFESGINNFLGSDKPSFLTIDEISDVDKHSCVGGPFGSDLGGKHYIEKPGVPVLRGSNLTTGGMPFIDSGFVYVSEDKADSLSRNMAYPGDVVVTQRGTLGQVGLIPYNSNFKRYVVSQSQMKLTVDKSKALPEYVYLYLLSARARRHLDVVTISTGVPHINLGIFKKFPILLPPLNIQRQIVDDVKRAQGTLEKISLNEAAMKNLEKSIINQVF
jgi:type I restriction enzyme S subunit